LSKPKQVTSALAKNDTAGRHEAVFYSDDRQLLDHLSRFIAAALNAGNGAVVVATRAHQESLVQSLEASGVDVAAALKQGRYIVVDAADALSSCMANGMFVSTDFSKASKISCSQRQVLSRESHPRVAFFGECVDLLRKQGNAEAAIQAEKLGNQLAARYAMDILCGFNGSSGRYEKRSHPENLRRAFSRLS
jgi:hypothetical protein